MLAPWMDSAALYILQLSIVHVHLLVSKKSIQNKAQEYTDLQSSKDAWIIE